MSIGKESLWDVAVRLSNEQKEELPSSGSQPKERTLLILGSRDVGKTSLIHRFLDRNESAKQTLALEYTFGRKAGKSLVKDVCHIWELGGGTLFPTLLTAPLAAASQTLCNLTVILMLDLSAPQRLWFTLETLIQALHTALRKHASLIRKENSGKFIEKLQAEAWSRVGQDNEEFDPEKKKVVCRCLSKSISQDYNKPLLIPAGSDSMQQIGGLGPSNTGIPNKGPGGAIDRWKHIFTTHFPQEASKRSAMPDDPAKDMNFQEPVIDSLRTQKDDELERYRQEAERRRQFLNDMDDI
ncbi:Cytoplasmic dynein 2 light intermediate chain 1 [Blattella germanica]|nr:Cytoplasmic dynein 2 light intermediate chain 1 [Blattella germanica]